MHEPLLERVSVILPVHNGAVALPAALRSLEEQSYEALELIVVDDHSLDSTPDLLRGARFPFPHRVIRLTQHEGIVSALEAGIAVATGAYIARMDADDTCHRDRMRLQAAALTDDPDLGVVSCRVDYGGCQQTQAGYARYVSWTNELLSHESMALARFRESPLAHPTVMFRRSLLKMHGGYRSGSFPEDYELWLRWFAAGVRFRKLEQALLRWNDPKDRLSRTHCNYKPHHFFQMKAGYLAEWLKERNPHHPDIVVVGAGRLTRRRAEMLLPFGIRIAAWTELDPKKIGRHYHGAPVLHHRDLPLPGEAFIVPFISSIGAPEAIRSDLLSRRYLPGLHFIEAG
jgi:glycosyltransferase involved in cell wall biosynthesis